MPKNSANRFLSQLILSFWILGALSNAFAADPLPYSTRTRNFTVVGTSPYGDIQSVGMSGATLGIENSFFSGLDNPAGLAMTLDHTDFSFTEDTVYDGNIQNSNNPTFRNTLGLAVSGYPWGFSLGYVVPYTEGQTYSLNNDNYALQTSVREFRLSAAHVFLDNRVALGLGLTLGQAQNKMTVASSGANYAEQSYAIGGTLGASIQLPQHLLVGLSYSLPMHYAFSMQGPTPGISNYFQSIEVPSRIGLGLGWIPNRFFRADFSTFLIGPSPNAALLRDDSILVGQNYTFMPRLGVGYNFVDYGLIKATAYAGTYLEISRINNTPSRLHATFGLQANPWIFYVGGGFDISANYDNYLFSLGLDLVELMKKLDLVPPMPHPPYRGLLPPPTHFSDEGLARPLVKDWQDDGSQLSPLEFGREIQKRIQEKAKELSDDVKKSLEAEPEKEPTHKDSARHVRTQKQNKKKKLSPRKTKKKVRKPSSEAQAST